VSSDRLPAHDRLLLDGLRAVAALMVLTTHVGFQTGVYTASAAGAVVARLDIGVALFFVLSGFLLVRPWLAAAQQRRTAPSTRRYLRRRMARIVPAYWALVAVALVTTAAAADPSSALAHVLLLQIYIGSPLPGLTQTWSLCTEVSFYAVLPFVAPTVARWARTATGRRRLLGLMTACVLVAWTWTALAAAGVLPHRSGAWLPGHLDWFVAGVALAVAESHARSAPDSRSARAARDLRGSPGAPLLLAAVLFWLACTPLGGPLTLVPATPATAVLKEMLYCLVAGLVVLAVGNVDQRRGWLAAGLGNRGLQAAGRVSYGVFLWHLVVLAGVLAVLHRPLFTGGFWPVLILTATGTGLAAAVSWRVLEAPVLRWAHRGGSAEAVGASAGTSPPASS
jgi:peptidoglycan/LPS O-acetylase OafA/YrhL